MKTIGHIFNTHNDGRKTIGHRMMRKLLTNFGHFLSKTTVHKYMNGILRLFSTVFKKKCRYKKGKQHEIFDNLLNQNFNVSEKNKI